MPLLNYLTHYIFIPMKHVINSIMIFHILYEKNWLEYLIKIGVFVKHFYMPLVFNVYLFQTNKSYTITRI